MCTRARMPTQLHTCAYAHTHSLALISPHFNLGSVTTMRHPTSDSKLFLFSGRREREKKKTSRLPVWRGRMAVETKRGVCAEGAVWCVQPCVCAWGTDIVCVHVKCMQTVEGQGSWVCIRYLAHTWRWCKRNGPHAYSCMQACVFSSVAVWYHQAAVVRALQSRSAWVRVKVCVCGVLYVCGWGWGVSQQPLEYVRLNKPIVL